MSFSKYLPPILILAGLIFSTIGCASKLVPQYSGVDPEAKPYIDEWIGLARQRGIVFDDSVTVGFTDIRSGQAIGMTHYGLWFREIDLDRNFWDYSNSLSRAALVFHECTHAYCDRIHDYGKDKPYSDSEKIAATKKDGFYKDGCPIPIMHPVILSNECFMVHYNHYIDEMFDRCVAW